MEHANKCVAHMQKNFSLSRFNAVGGLHKRVQNQLHNRLINMKYYKFLSLNIMKLTRKKKSTII